MKAIIFKAICVITVLFISLMMYAQSNILTVTGKVIDETGNPLIGVSIMEKGTDNGTVTNADGKYSLDVTENSTLRFSYLGYAAQNIAVGNQQIINVVMDEGIVIDPAKPINLTAKQREKTEADNSFAFKMFREVSKEKGTNIFFSPFSLNIVLGMLYNGSSGNTRTEIAKVLDITNISLPEINEYYNCMLNILPEIDPITDIVIANSIWYRYGLTVKNSFIETGKKYFNADVQALDFSNSNTVNIINKWCVDNTKNRINEMVVNPTPNDRMFILNALYFKSKWEAGKKFDDTRTKLDDFTKTNGQKIKVNLMEQTNYLPYYSDQNLQCVELPYGNQAFSMIAILPSEDMDVNQLIEALGNVKWENIVNGMRQQKVWLKLPQFKIECNISLYQPLMNLGMKKIFSDGFANISDASLWVSNIIQKTFVEVNEDGTEASALSAVIVVGFAGQRRAPDEPVRFFADRPFLFLIREKSTGVILFIGRIDEPQAEKQV